MKLIPLKKGKFAQVDNDLFGSLSKHRWFCIKGRHTCYAARYIRGIDGRNILISMHREIMGLSPGDGKMLDHADLNGLNNQRQNLRFCTHTENLCNAPQRANRSSRYKGVYYHIRSRKWISRIRYSHTEKHLGCFDSEIDAAVAYDNAAIKCHGEFARLNFIHNPESAPCERQGAKRGGQLAAPIPKAGA